VISCCLPAIAKLADVHVVLKILVLWHQTPANVRHCTINNLVAAEELVVMITPCASSAFNRNRFQGVSDISAGKKSSLKLKTREVDKTFMIVDASSLIW